MVQADGEGEEGMNSIFKFYDVFEQVMYYYTSILQIGVLRKSEQT